MQLNVDYRLLFACTLQTKPARKSARKDTQKIFPASQRPEVEHNLTLRPSFNFLEPYFHKAFTKGFMLETLVVGDRF